mgnify:CR=1 FL=1
MVDRTSFIRGKFAEFYETESDRIRAPDLIERREFGFLLFGEKIMIRHKSFKKVEDLRRFLKETVPLHVYYSTAYYENPEGSMEEKGWIGADLYFDIDADHIPTPCGKIHDRWRCGTCGFSGRGTPPERCPICGNRGFEEKTWPCEVCLESARLETIKLLDILTEDFGFAPNEIKTSFSGHRGYHVNVENEEIRTLDSTSRKEIVDYITGVGLDAQFHGLGRSGTRAGVIVGPHLGDAGWRGRIARGVYEFLLKATREDLEEIGLKRKVINAIISNRELILKSWDSSGPWGIIRGVGLESWRTIIEQGIKTQSTRIDTVVTTDIHRLIRLSNTLHGKTGLLKVEFPAKEIENFDPFKEAIAFTRGEVTVFVEEAPEFRLGDETFGPFRRVKVELPMAAALLLLCKGLAEVVG